MTTHNTRSRRWMNLKLQTLGLIILLSNAPSLATAESQSFTLGDLPTCALMCATQAASAVNCTLSDTACLCSHPDFTTSTIQCADTNGQCPIEDRTSVDGVLGAICSAGSTMSASSSSSSSSSSSLSSSQDGPISTSKGLGPGPIKPLPSTTSNTSPSLTSSPPTSQTAPSATPSSTNNVSSLILSSQSSATSAPTAATTPASQSASSTTVVVQTIMVPPTSLASSAVREQWDVWIMMFLGVVGMYLCDGI